MLIGTSTQAIFGVFLIVVGLMIIIFHKELKQMKDEWYEHLPPALWRGPMGTLLKVTLIVFGAISILIGIVQLLIASVQN